MHNLVRIPQINPHPAHPTEDKDNYEFISIIPMSCMEELYGWIRICYECLCRFFQKYKHDRQPTYIFKNGTGKRMKNDRKKNEKRQEK